MGVRSRGDALAAVVEASLDARLDPMTVAMGCGYSSVSNCRRALQRIGRHDLSDALRRQGGRVQLPPADEIIGMLDYGMTAYEVMLATGGSPEGLAKKVKRANRQDIARRFYALGNNLTRRQDH